MDKLHILIDKFVRKVYREVECGGIIPFIVNKIKKNENLYNLIYDDLQKEYAKYQNWQKKKANCDLILGLLIIHCKSIYKNKDLYIEFSQIIEGIRRGDI